jgi:hypothetical protein
MEAPYEQRRRRGRREARSLEDLVAALAMPDASGSPLVVLTADHLADGLELPVTLDT